MSGTSPIEAALAAALEQGSTAPACPPKLAEAMHYAVFPGGARVRPRLCLAVADACGGRVTTVAVMAATALELLHCASLVHDDLPCFDDAALRRGKPSLHRAMGEPIALLTGDALIVLAFEVLAGIGGDRPNVLAPLLSTVSRGVGGPAGIVAGQAWECEPQVVLADYHRAKTGALFVAATEAGALVSGAEPADWRPLGERIGEAYQVADDLRDAAGDCEELGKPVGRDAALGRPSAARELGIARALDRMDELLAAAIAAIPDCPGAADLEDLIQHESRRLVPKGIARLVA
jgi:geranylgeranyl diphosphate synthase type II